MCNSGLHIQAWERAHQASARRVTQRVTAAGMNVKVATMLSGDHLVAAAQVQHFQTRAAARHSLQPELRDALTPAQIELPQLPGAHPTQDTPYQPFLQGTRLCPGT